MSSAHHASEKPADPSISSNGASTQPTPPDPERKQSDWTTFVPPPDLSLLVERTDVDPVGAGAYADIYSGALKRTAFETFQDKWRHEKDPEFAKVAIKVMRPILAVGTEGYEKLKRRLDREIALWQRLEHENIQPFLGISNGFGRFKAIISPWQANGNIANYLAKFPDANRYELLRGIASGMAYLHENDPQIVHGDIKPDNILISTFGTPLLADFGISAVHEEATFWLTNTSSVPGTPRYMAPELLSGECTRYSTETDTYAWAISAYEILTDIKPYPQYLNAGQVAIAVVNRGERPLRPDTLLPQPHPPPYENNFKTATISSIDSAGVGIPHDTAEENYIEGEHLAISDTVWNLLERSWAPSPEERPTMREVERLMERMCSDERPLRLLSIDGTGIRVFGALACLKKIMDHVGEGVKPCEVFDMIAGSGTGGIASILLGRLHLSVDQAIELLREHLPKVYNELVNHLDLAMQRTCKWPPSVLRD